MLEVILKSILAVSRRHLAGTTGGLGMLWPRPLDLLSTDAANSAHQVEGVLVVTFFFMRAEVVLRDSPTKLPWTTRELDLEVTREALEPLHKVQLELARDVVGKDHQYLRR